MHATTILRIAVAAALLGTAPAQADDTIRPGDFHRLSDSIWCTLNFVFDGVGPAEGRVFIGSAAHCVLGAGSGVGKEVTLGSGPDNGTSDVAGTTGGEVLGTVALLGGDGSGPENDFALIEVRPELRSRVQAGVRGHEDVPSGVAGDLAQGDRLIHTGYGIPFFATAPTREDRQGLFLARDDQTWSAEMAVYGGDSGGPVVDAASGGALGALFGFFASTLPDPDVHAAGPTVPAIVARATALGLPIRMRAVGDPVPPPPSPPPPPAPNPTPEPARPAAAPPQRTSPAPAAARPPVKKTARKAKRRPACRRHRGRRRCAKKKPAARRQ